MNAELPISHDVKPRWRRRLAVTMRRGRVIPLVEIATVVALIAIAVVSYFVVTQDGKPEALLTPATVAALMVANLLPAMALMVLIARRVARRRASRSPLGGRGRLHVRLAAVFSLIASVPTLMLVVFASLLFQSGVQFWFSDRARGMLENAATIAQEAYQGELERVSMETQTMGGDIVGFINENSIDHPDFAAYLFQQALYRNLSEAVLVRVTEDLGVQTLALVNPHERSLEADVKPEMLRQLEEVGDVAVGASEDRVSAVTSLGDSTYLYAARVFEPRMAAQLDRSRAIISDYNALLDRARTLQLRFNAALLVVSLLIIAATIWIALRVADRLVRPVNELVDAARRVTGGDLSARVPNASVKDEVGTLGNAFNRMTRRLEEQTGALVSANQQLDSRRVFTEAVLSGVTAGVISLDPDRTVRLINSSAEAMLKTSKADAIGQKLAVLAPELDEQFDSDEREAIVQFASGGEPRTLAIKRVKVEGGHVLTFDDITEQLLDQRRAAWSDVARRIAHEIKNPLTPIQLAAERLQRRYGKEIVSDPGTFTQLTGTIVRQVGDLRRMVDEFSSFARMPKPVFREEAIAEVARQALFLHEVAHPDIAFRLEAPEPAPLLVCDRRQLGQALTNIVKNGVEAIQQKREEGAKDGEDAVAMRIIDADNRLCIEVTDTGVGLPADRGRLTEPYVTTRVKGTGLGLAIVKKIVEEHFGSIEFDDAPGGGTLVRLVFDSESLARLAAGAAAHPQDQAANG